MTDKIITTFETMITWFNCSDKLPTHLSNVFFRTKNGNFNYAIFMHKFTENGEDTFMCDSGNYPSKNVEWWAYLPEFD